VKRRPPEKKPLTERLFVGLFIAGFFSILPLWALSNREGWLRFHCGGSPWTCTITHRRAFSTHGEGFGPSAIDFSRSHFIDQKGYTSRHWRLLFTVDGRVTPVVTGDDEGVPMEQLARELEAARAANIPIDRELPPDWGFWLLVGVAALFACAGLFVAWSA